MQTKNFFSAASEFAFCSFTLKPHFSLKEKKQTPDSPPSVGAGGKKRIANSTLIMASPYHTLLLHAF